AQRPLIEVDREHLGLGMVRGDPDRARAGTAADIDGASHGSITASEMRGDGGIEAVGVGNEKYRIGFMCRIAGVDEEASGTARVADGGAPTVACSLADVGAAHQVP